MENVKLDFLRKITGFALIIGSILSLVGNVVHPNLPEEKGLDTSAFINLIQNNQSIWYLSHLILFALIPILLFGIIGICILLYKNGEYVYSILCALFFGFWAVLNAIVIIVDGFVIPDIINNISQDTTTITIFDFIHLAILNTLSFSLFFWSLGFIFLGILLIKSKLFKAIISWSGLGIGVVGVVGYIVGIFGKYWVLGNIFTFFAIIFTIWLFIFGIAVLKLSKYNT